jgi:ribose/xylose/arabinose/galactoside ABC-type transport system permease subunit
MRHINPGKAAISVGSVVGLWHLIWVTLVGIGWAKPVMDFILRLHFIDLNYTLAPYSTATAVTLVLLTFTIGALFGLIFALVWNWLSLESAPTWARDTKRPTPAE